MGFTKADHLFPQENIHEAERIICGRMGFAVVHGVDSRQRIFLCKDLIEPGGSKIFPDMLQRIAKSFSNSAGSLRSFRIRRSCPF